MACQATAQSTLIMLSYALAIRYRGIVCSTSRWGTSYMVRGGNMWCHHVALKKAALASDGLPPESV